MKTNILITSIILFLFVGCQTKKEFTDADKEKILQELKVESSRMWDLMNSDFDDETFSKMTAFIDKDIDKLWQTDPIVCSFNFFLIKSYKEWEDFLKEIIDNRTSNRFIKIESHYMVLSDVLVLEVITADYNVTSKEGETFGPFQMVNNSIWQKKDGVWRILHLQQSYGKKKVEQ